MKVGVTGASGFIGRKLTKKLLDSGYEVKKFVRREPQSEDEIYWSPSKKEIDKDKFKELDAVIHLAGESMHQRIYLAFFHLLEEGGIKKENQEFTGLENGLLIYLLKHIKVLKNIQKYLFQLQV